MTDYIVANCETTWFNGTYIQVDTSFWEKSDGGYTSNLYYLVVADCMVLEDNDSTEIYYDNNYGGNLPPDDPSIDWYSLSEETPSALTVTAAGGGDPSSIINHIMHYRRLMSR